MQNIYGYVYGLQSPKNKWYVGQTTEKDVFKYIEKNYSKKQGYRRPKIERAIKKYGFNSFKVVILSICYSAEELNNTEKELIKKYNCLGHTGYNCIEGGLGGKKTEEVKIKMSIAAKKQYANGRVPSNKNVPMSEEQKIKLSNSRKIGLANGSIVPVKIHCSEETKLKISKANSGKHMSIKTEFKKGVIPYNTGKEHLPGLKNPNAKILKIENILTKEIKEGLMQDVLKEINISRYKLLKHGICCNWKLISLEFKRKV